MIPKYVSFFLVWGRISQKGKSRLKVIKGTVNAATCQVQDLSSIEK